MYFLYSLALVLAALVTFPYFLVVGLRRGKYLRTFGARLGRVPRARRPARSRRVWVRL